MKIEILKHNTFREFLDSNYSFEEKEGYISIKESLTKEIKRFLDLHEGGPVTKILDCSAQSILRLTESQFIQLADRFCTEAMGWLDGELFRDMKALAVLESYECGGKRLDVFDEFALSFLSDMYEDEIRELNSNY